MHTVCAVPGIQKVLSECWLGDDSDADGGNSDDYNGANNNGEDDN
jgi:hypothetical protein